MRPNREPYDQGMLYTATDTMSIGRHPTIQQRARAGPPWRTRFRPLRRLAEDIDPHVYLIVLFEQRGRGKSTPLANAPNVDLSANAATCSLILSGEISATVAALLVF